MVVLTRTSPGRWRDVLTIFSQAPPEAIRGAAHF
jgi:hypothetical protein